MDETLAEQQSLFNSVARSLDNFKKIGRNNYTVAKIHQRISMLKETWSKCIRRHAALTQLFTAEQQTKEAYFKDHLLDKCEDVYMATLDYMADELAALEPNVSSNRSTDAPVASTSSSSLSLQHLPPIQLPPFSGNFEEWEPFRDRFQSLIIDNQNLSNFSKMHFLVSSLKGRAREAIDSTLITADNFALTWASLKRRYENKRRLIEVHVSSLYNLPQIARESPSDLHALRDKADKAISALKNLNRSPEEIMSDIIVYFVSQKLDPDTRRAWKLKFGEDSPPPTYADLSRFMSSRALALEELSLPNSSKSNRGSKATSSTASSSSVIITCPICKKGHLLNKCTQFISKTPNQRRDIVKQYKRCFNCLSDRHSVNDCISRFTCRSCHKKHHSMLHVDSTELQANTVSSDSEQAQLPVETRVNSHSVVPRLTRPINVLLATARIKVRSVSGREQTVRALLDQGSEVTFITERLAQSLRLKRLPTRTAIIAVGNIPVGTCRHAVQIQLLSRHSSTPQFSVQAFVRQSLSSYAPRGTSSDLDWTHFDKLILADDNPTSSDSFDILIGADIYGSILLDGIHQGPAGQPTAQNSHFGWILSGPFTSQNLVASHINVSHCALEQNLRRFWELEEIPVQPILSADDKLCEEHFQATHSRDSHGRYIVRLPFKNGPPIDIGESRSNALRLFKTLHRRLESKLELKHEYDAFLSEYELLGHMTKVPSAISKDQQTVYIPHHSVVRESSSTTRVRVVFNASNKTSNGTSLNDHLLAGPKLQTDLFAVLLRWRLYKHIYTADIAKMYRQILVDTRDQDYQRILWSSDSADQPQDYQLLTVTYGTASAPFLALRVLKQLIQDEGSSFPLAIPVLQDNIYVDDVLFGAEEISLLKQTREQVCALLQRGGFELRKWASNSAELLADIPSENHGLACHKVLQADDRVSILGITWQPALDTFQFQISTPTTISNTKREVLSTIAKLFDPLGWVTPVIIKAKIFMQELWRIKLDWDDPLPPLTKTKWAEIQNLILDLNGLQLPRWVGIGSDTISCELHGFADASTVAYAAAVYIRVTSVSGETTTQLLAGKSKVAPVKPISVPRLELSAAVLLARLLDFVRLSLKLTKAPCYCWTDSTVTLAWLTQDPSKWKTFVAHRVAAVQTLIPYAKWLHVSTEHNPADCASRGNQKELSRHSLWWQGPEWLKLPDSHWPSSVTSASGEELEEARLRTTHATQFEEPWELSTRFSSWPKLIKVTAYIFRFVNSCRIKYASATGSLDKSIALSDEDCQHARIFWLKFIQRDLFRDDLHRLQHNRSLLSKNQSLKLNPFLDNKGLIRVGGRLKNAPLPFKTKHPILLADHALVRLIVRHAHLRSLHADLQLTLATLRDFWILKSRNIVKAIIHSCIVCTRERATVPTQLMGQLPSARVTPTARAFRHCGIDYAGPIATRSSSGRGITSRKSYLAVFICLVTRAIHLELVSDYSSSAFLNAFTRFYARRGLPEVMYSDNGTTFTGADRELTKSYRSAIRDPGFLNSTAADKISWKFIPPHAPHFGGLWEAGVKSVKHHLRRVVGSHTLTFEELTTVLCKIEACLNSRPLGPLSASLDDYEPLTPGHFLIGSALTVSPEPSVLHLKENRLSRWQLVQHLIERFWRLWQSDYVNALQQRSKWRKIQPSIKIGSLVLIRNVTLPPCKWEMGRVIQCHAGSDGLMRVVSIKTAHSEYKRPIAQLCLLPIDIESQADDKPTPS